MKTRKKIDLDKLGVKIQDELGIDVAKYRSPEVTEKFFELLMFPQYISTWISIPVIIAFLLYIGGYFVLDLPHIDFLIYAIFGGMLFMICGFILGLLLLTWKMKTDMLDVVQYSLGIMKTGVQDLKYAQAQITPDNRKEKYGLLFKGIVHLVTIPSVTDGISNRIPFVGSAVKGMMSRILTTVARFFKFDEVNESSHISPNEEAAEEIPQEPYDTSSIDNTIERVESFMNRIFGISQTPLWIALVIGLIVLCLFIYLVN